MPKRKKKHEPEMLIVSFCDIVTIATAALFFALIITVQQAVKVPIFKPTPRAVATDKKASFFECRNDQVFWIDKDGLDAQVAKLLSTITGGVGVHSGDIAGFTKVINGVEVGNDYYKVLPAYLLTMVMALEPKPGVQGDTEKTLYEADSKFQEALRKLDSKTQYVVFLVRDDSFNVFRNARKEADTLGFDVGWELLGIDEPIKFGTGGQSVEAQ